MYSDFIFHSRDSVDCLIIYTKAERCYQCINVDNSYQCQYCILVNNSSNCMYCYDLRGCTDCFLSVNLRNKSNYFLNKKYSKEEYKAKVKEFQLGSYKTRQKLYDRFLDILKKQALYKYAIVENSVDVTGNYIFDSKNAKKAFDIADCEDVKYVANVEDTVKDTRDSYRNAHKIELVNECNALIRVYDLKFCNVAYDVAHLEYCDNCFNSQDLFGCVGFKKGEYCILNKRYDKESFTALKKRIIAHMKSTGEYGEYFPVALSPFGYNESHGQLHFPMEKEAVLAKGWKWENETVRTVGKETLQPADIPDDIADVDDSITGQVLKCTTCSKNYNIVKPELVFYRKENIPIPRECYDCRDNRRLSLRAPHKLWSRQCMCDYEVYSNTIKHNHHETGRCPNTFQTSYSPERKEIVYCEKCYQAEVI